MIDPSAINGDQPLNRQQRSAYMLYHEARNRRNADRPAPRAIRFDTPTDADAMATPARASLTALLEAFASQLAKRYADRPITILDIGCGAGTVAKTLAAAGVRGRYLGIDNAAHAGWDIAELSPDAGLVRERLTTDVLSIEPSQLPIADVLLSVTALEHIAEDHRALNLLRRRLAPGGIEMHIVPGEAALPLYGPHGWRQYTPACLAGAQGLLPDGFVYGLGGPASAAFHRVAVSPGARGKRSLRQARPTIYPILRDAAMMADRLAARIAPRQRSIVYAVTNLPLVNTPVQHAIGRAA